VEFWNFVGLKEWKALVAEILIAATAAVWNY